MLHWCGIGGTERDHDWPKVAQRGWSDPTHVLLLQLQGKPGWRPGHVVPAGPSPSLGSQTAAGSC